MDDQDNAVEIDTHMRDLTSQFCNRFQDFQHFGLLFFAHQAREQQRLELICIGMDGY